MSAELAREGRGACVSTHASGVGAFGPVPPQRALLAPRAPRPRSELDSAPLKKVLSVSARELRMADESEWLSPGLSPRSRPVRHDRVVGFLGVVGGAWVATRDRDCSKELDRSRTGSWALGHFRPRGICRCVGPRKVWRSGTVWRGLAALPPRSCRDKLDGTLLKSLKVWRFRPGGMGGRVAPGAACSLAPILDAKDHT